MRSRFAIYIVGTGLSCLAILMLLFSLYGLLLREPYLYFLLTALVTGVLGFILIRLGDKNVETTRREALIGVLVLWLVLPLFGAAPYWLSGTLSPLNAIFESMSGFTTTGATVIEDFSRVPQSLFMWRSLEQWLGGIGIIVLFIAVFPQLAIAGRQLFFTEAPGHTEERLSPRLRSTANAVLIIYIGLTVLCIFAYLLSGMSLFNAIAHALTTIAAGGFSPHPASLEGFNAATQWVTIVFIGLAGINFSLQYRAFILRRPRALWQDAEFRAYLTIIILATGLLTYILNETYGLTEGFRHSLFQTLTILTGAGFASVDFAAWSLPAQTVLIVLMFIGGCAGSAAGGVKIVRWLIVGRSAAKGIRQILYPRAVLHVRVGNRLISNEVIQAVSVFLTLYFALFVFSIAVLIFFGADFLTAFTASIACVGNIGPGLAGVGPMANFADLHPVSRGLLTFDMYAGRLEVVTVLVLLDPSWWRLPRIR